MKRLIGRPVFYKKEDTVLIPVTGKMRFVLRNIMAKNNLKSYTDAIEFAANWENSIK